MLRPRAIATASRSSSAARSTRGSLHPAIRRAIPRDGFPERAAQRRAAIARPALVMDVSTDSRASRARLADGAAESGESLGGIAQRRGTGAGDLVIASRWALLVARV